MSALVQGLRQLPSPTLPRPSPGARRGAPFAAVLALAAATPDGLEILLAAASEAYLAVSVFVAGSLLVLHAFERLAGVDLGGWLRRNRRWQVPLGSLLGALPGCGGAIVAVTQFTRGNLSFGAVVATLTATMGDAMFLLLAREPMTALAVLLLSMVAGTATGLVVDALHRPGFTGGSRLVEIGGSARVEAAPAAPLSRLERLWLAIAAPGLVVGVLAAFQVDLDALLFADAAMAPTLWLGVAGAALAVAMWVLSVGAGQSPGLCPEADEPLLRRVITGTNTVTIWVVLAFVGFELLQALGGFQPDALFAVWGAALPAVAILVGLIPGCGPQILVTSLYLEGALPLSAQLGNALANDGDALFPALVVAPRAALLATVYSAVPALLLAYGWYLLVE